MTSVPGRWPRHAVTNHVDVECRRLQKLEGLLLHPHMGRPSIWLQRSPSMPPLVNLQQIADAAGVHRSTASRALNPKYREALSPDLVLKVTAAAEKLGYRPNAFAAGLRTRRSKLVGVLLPDIASPIFSRILSSITSELSAEGLSALLMVGDSDAQIEQAAQHLLALQVEGVVIGTARTKDSHVSAFLAHEIPVVLAHRQETRLRATTVVSDNDSGVKAVMNHLDELGHKRVGMVVGPQNHSPGRRRANLFTREAQRRGMDHGIAVAKDWSIESGRAGAMKLLEGQPSLTAIFAANDMMAFGVLEELAAKGLSCPRDVSVVGYNDMPFSSMVSPPLTTVSVDLADQGRQVALQLLAPIHDHARPPQLIVVPVQLVVRASTARARP